MIKLESKNGVSITVVDERDKSLTSEKHAALEVVEAIQVEDMKDIEREESYSDKLQLAEYWLFESRNATVDEDDREKLEEAMALLTIVMGRTAERNE